MRPPKPILKPVFVAGWVCVALFAIWQIQLGAGDSSTALSAGILLLATLVFSRYVLGLSFTTSPMLYLALLGLFHLGLVVPWALGIYDVVRITWFMPHGLSRAIALIIYSIVAYQIGVIAALGRRGYQRDSPLVDGLSLENSEVFAAGCLLFLTGAIMFTVGLIALDPLGYYRLTYTETFRLRAEFDPRFFGSGMTIAFIGLSLAVSGASKQRLRTIFLGGGVWLLALFFWGFRGPALISGLLVCAVSLKKGVRFPRWFAWVAVAFLLIALPAVRLARDEPADERFFHMSSRDFNILDGPAEMGASIRPLVETADYIGPWNYRYGRTYLMAIKGVVPNLALRWEAPATESTEDLPPGHWITLIADPWSYKNNGGIGFSAIAEPYMNFGTEGVVAYFFLVAILLVWLEKVSLESSYALASWSLILGPLLWTTRNDFFNFFRPVVWGLLCLGAVRAFSEGFAFIPRTGKPNRLELKTKTVK
ncbi:MAG TPA: O-antigen polysaccharide polymerase Wzy [Candidatus Acidoferrum sp.]|nr:O-antigen polysaccharide polymerase Wzy [Candidatus Acidoferrum sp.]